MRAGRGGGLRSVHSREHTHCSAQYQQQQLQQQQRTQRTRKDATLSMMKSLPTRANSARTTPPITMKHVPTNTEERGGMGDGEWGVG